MSLKRVITLLKYPGSLIQILGARGYLNWVPDKIYLKILYRLTMKKPLNLKAPRSFNEKLQWLKIYDHKPEYTQMVDKYTAKRYVAERVGEDQIIPTYGVWTHFDEIDFDKLPDQFVLKCTHDSGGLVICRDKKTLDKDKAKARLEKSLGRNYYWQTREWPYKNVPPRIIAEQYIVNDKHTPLIDYKFYCFNGKPEFLYVSKGLEDHAQASISFLTLDWEFAPYKRSDYRMFTELPQKPKTFDQMVATAEKLSSGIDFLRVDLYEVNGKLLFSELTFSPCAGMMPFENPEDDLQIGKMLTLTGQDDARLQFNRACKI